MFVLDEAGHMIDEDMGMDPQVSQIRNLLVLRLETAWVTSKSPTNLGCILESALRSNARSIGASCLAFFLSAALAA